MTPGVDLYWIPLGAGECVVEFNGRVYEAILAGAQRRPRAKLYHSALQVYARGGRYVIEVTPVPDDNGADRGVVGTGPVGVRGAGRFRIFRYEVRCWRGGMIPDLTAAVGGPTGIAAGEELAERVLDIAPGVPTPTWGRDELRAGEMWNSNSVVSWLLVRAGLDVEHLGPPIGGRAPGWHAGLVVARRAGRGGPGSRGSGACLRRAIRRTSLPGDKPDNGALPRCRRRGQLPLPADSSACRQLTS